MKTKKQSIASTIGLIILLVATSSHASTFSLSSFATIDLNTADYITVSGDATFLPSFGSEFTDALVSANGANIDNDPNSASLNINEDGGSVSASAEITPLTLLSTVNVINRGFGSATAEYILDYTITGSGEIEVSVPYQITIDPLTSATTDPNSNAFAQVSIEDASSSLSDTQFIDFFQSEGDGEGPIDNIGSLTFLINVNDGDAGSFRFLAEAGSDLFTPAAVPLPPSGFLMLSSLFGIFIGTRRRTSVK